MHRSLKPDQVYVAADILILSVRSGKLCLMLSRRTDPPYEGLTALPGTFLALEESGKTAVRRLLNEMLPIPDPFIEQLYTFTHVNRDPRGRVISIAYLVIVPPCQLEEALSRRETILQPWEASLKPDALCLTGPEGEELTGSDLGFDHGRIIETGIRRLQGKIEYTDIGFYFLNNVSAFSLSELQTIYEAVLGTSLDSSNFRRSIMTRYEKSGRLWQTAQAEKKGRGRPAVLYRFDLI